MERIIAAVDGSSSSLKAAALAADLVSKYDAELVLLTVLPELSAAETAALKTYARLERIDVPVNELATENAQDVLETARHQAERNGANKLSTRASRGDPAEVIISAGKQQNAELIVVGSRGHGRLTGLLLG